LPQPEPGNEFVSLCERSIDSGPLHETNAAMWTLKVIQTIRRIRRSLFGKNLPH
jgi:hypothetical protein